MKNYSSVLLAILLILTAFPSCIKDVSPDSGDIITQKGKVAMEIQAGFSGSRTTLDNFPVVTWQNSDAIAVWDGSEKSVFTIKSGTNQGSTATFEGSVAEGATSLWALFPASAFGSFDGSAFTATVPARQTVQAGAVSAPGATLATGQVDGSNHISFKNAIGLVKFTIGEEFDGQIHSVTIEGAGGEALAGKAVFEAGTGALVSVSAPETSVSLEAATGKSLAAGDYYIAVLPVTLSGGFTLTFKNLSGSKLEKSTGKSMSIPRNGGKDLGTVTGGIGEFNNIITTADELMEWNENTVFSPGDVYKLGADIDMSGKEWKPRSDFQGTFDGQGHRIYNLEVTTSEYVGFIRTTKEGGTACIKNLVIGSSDGVNWDGVSHFTHASSSNNYTWYYVGVIAKTMGTVELENITNFAAIEVASTATSKTRIAGICGNIAGTGTVKNCINYGSVTNNAPKTGVTSSSDSSTAAGAIAGIAAQCDVAATFDGCINYGTLTNNNPGTFAIGGIVGNTSYAKLIKDCSNYGAIVLNSTYSGSNTYVGGILGTGKGGLKLQDCTNYADFEWKTFNNTTYGGGVLGYIASGPVTGCVNEGSVTVTSGGKYGNWCSFGGVAASLYTTASMSNCENHKPVSVYFEQTVRVGGVCGTLNSSCSITGCKNTADINCSANVENNRWLAVGGICGFQEKVSGSSANSISNCENSGNVSLGGNYKPTSGTAHNNGGCVGGIIGFGCLTLNIKDNVNKGQVSALNTSSVGMNAGGIIGKVVTGAGITSSGNVNEGNVSSDCSDSSNPIAGGIIGHAGVSSYKATSDNNYAAVSCGNPANAGSVAGVNAATLTNCGAGGSVCGTALNADNFSSYVQGSSSTGTHSGTTFVSK